MIPELGQFALVLALVLAVIQSTLPIIGAHRGNAAWMAVARPAVYGQATFTTIAFLALTYAFVTQDFSVAYVAQNSNLLLPMHYRISAVWGAHEGSLLLWVLILSIWTVAVAAFSRSVPDGFVARVLGVMGWISIGFHPVYPADVQPVPASRAGTPGRQRPESPAPGSWPHHSSADALYGLRRVFR